MRLKRLTIKGFKSFADDTVIHFNENLIGIVGPNGSGKSNVVDSIRWVLGEQKTSELRLESMSDVLFNGTKARKEGKVAKVTLSFDNTKNVLPTEYNEVSISRVLYRSGQSEYQLNGVTCRKKDITNLFMDSGIGSNSYAIISLNMVEDILHDNGGSRRQMIEQAAGIAKYKVRKKETLSKLRRTTEDLDRVQDLLFEIEKNMASFERQAKRTERYNKLKEEYKDLSIKISHIEVKEYNQKFKELQEQIEKEKDLRLKINTEMTQDESTLQKMKKDILQYEQSLSVDQQQFNELIEELGKIENRKNLALQQLQNAKDRIIEIETSAEQLNLSISSGQSNLQTSTANSLEAEKLLKEEEVRYQEADKAYTLATHKYEDLRQQEKEIKSEQQKNQLLKETLGRETEALATRKSILETDIKIYSERAESIKQAGASEQEMLDAQSKKLEELSEKVAVAEKDVYQAEEDIQTANEELQQVKTGKSKKQVEISSIEQRIKFLKNIVDNHEGLPESVKFILKESGDQYQVMSDVIDIKDERYTKIIELFLEPYFHYLFAKDRVDAIKLYERVRDAQKGKINVIYPDGMQQVGTTASKGDLISLSSLISAPAEYQNFVHAICKDVYISSRSYRQTDIETLPQGDIVLFADEYLMISGGRLYGGSNTLFEGVQLGRKKLLEKLEKQYEGLQSELAQHDDQVTAAKKKIENVQIAQKEKRSKLSELRGVVDKEKSQLYQLQSQIKNQESNISDILAQVTAKKAELEKVKSDWEQKEARYKEIETIKIEDLSDEELTQRIEEAHNTYIQAGADRDQAKSALFEVRSKFDLATKDVQFYKNNIDSIVERIGGLGTEKSTQQETITQSEKVLEEVRSQLETKYTRRAELQEKLSAYEDTYYKDKGTIFELEKKISELRGQLYKKDQLITSLNETFGQVKFEIKAIHERNSIEFGIEIKEAEFPEEYEGANLEELQLKKTKINDRIRNYGEINPMAITAYNEIKERHDAISTERDDILEAKASLEETIAEIEKTASEKFNEALEHIRINFKKVFQSLFTEDDDCNIVLLESDDPLEAKIEIVAKPKGKRPKSISLLSGGEKTLTAASFLFALYLLKPAPFCIFDEVDAPLDDVNVLKFNKIIREFSQDSQFIIITHNKLTMSEVDILYGVYLKELGVSGVSAVDFRTYDQTEMAMAN